jgi:heme-degrading monooxygenase HmoA
MSNIKYAKHNLVRFRTAQSREEASQIFIEFFEELKKHNTNSNMKGYMILQNTADSKESIVLTFWSKEEDMQRFYSQDNKVLTSLVERIKPFFEKMPERTDFIVSESFMTIQ